jgi:OOP family OmpA-OmpF porin
MLSREDKAELDKCAEQAKGEKGYVIEVAGFASSDGDEALNRRLSQRRADAVIQYLAYNYSIPLRRFVMPMGYGEKQPVADNHTRAGRKENRRVEVTILVSKGITAPEGAANPANNSNANMSASNPQR